MGVRLRIHARERSLSNISPVISVANQAGASALTRTPRRAHCAASSRVRLTRPPFDAA
jgi:hypothetical protein